ncbi:MAG TPA: hypothetical protein VKE49_13185, partial [Myxococcaceae bacterium]|nr:hypothetical protein [Myxococcaceae bacterium]
AIWGALWLLIAFAVIAPLGSIISQQPRARSGAPSALAIRSDRRAPYAPSCQPGFVAVDGRCELGEEIEIRPPAGWRRR